MTQGLQRDTLGCSRRPHFSSLAHPSHTHIILVSPPSSSTSPLPLIQTLTQSEFYEATWAVVNSPSTYATKWGPIEDWDTSGVPSFKYAFSTLRNEGGRMVSHYNPKAKTFNGDLSKWNTSSVNNMKYTFGEASSFTGTGVDLWNINKVKDMTHIFNQANAITSCNKRKIADAWKNKCPYEDCPSDTDWAADLSLECSSTSGGITATNSWAGVVAATAMATAAVCLP